WLRLRLDGAGASVSFADPTPEVRTQHSASRRGTDSLVILAPSDRDATEWKPELKKAVTARLGFPKVGFVDFDRWFSNENCRALAFPERDGESEAEAKARAIDFHHQVMTAYLGRMIDPRLAALVDAVPDLSVSGLRFDICAI